MTSRTGVPALVDAAKELCRLLTKFTPLIKSLYPDSTGLHTALDNALVACAALQAALEAIRDYGD